MIQTAIDLGEEDVVALQAQRLPQEAAALAQLLAQQEYSQAMVWITAYRQNNTMLTEFIDPEVAALRLELTALENTLTSLTTQKADYERQMTEFNAAYMRKVSPTLEQVLRQRLQQEQASAAEQENQENKEDEEDLQQAQHDYEEFHRQQQEQPPSMQLSDEEKVELKKSYQQAVAKCHPDRLPEEQQELGTEKFKELREAYSQQDLPRLRKILAELEDGHWTLASETISDTSILRRRIANMRSAITALEVDINAIVKDDAWCLIESLTADGRSWDDYFSSVKSEMEKQLVAE